jgi:hypothetical protein
VFLLGPRRYADALRLINAFDVALIPHLDDAMTRAMQPLKAFVYCSLGVPVVSTAIANLEQLGDMITVAAGPEQFVRAIDDALHVGRASSSARAEFIAANSWAVRAERCLALVEARLAARCGI